MTGDDNGMIGDDKGVIGDDKGGSWDEKLSCEIFNSHLHDPCKTIRRSYDPRALCTSFLLGHPVYVHCGFV